jgi:hypothetical protein
MLGNEVPAAFALLGRPPQPRVADPQMQTGTRVAEQSDPLAVGRDGHVPQDRSDQRGIVQVVFAFQQRVEAWQFGRFD